MRIIAQYKITATCISAVLFLFIQGQVYAQGPINPLKCVLTSGNIHNDNETYNFVTPVQVWIAGDFFQFTVTGIDAAGMSHQILFNGVNGGASALVVDDVAYPFNMMANMPFMADGQYGKAWLQSCFENPCLDWWDLIFEYECPSCVDVNVGVEMTPATCNMPNGTATATGHGSTQNYAYLWTGPNGYTAQGVGSNNTITGLAAGTYKVTTTDGNGCTATNTITVTAFGQNDSTRIDLYGCYTVSFPDGYVTVTDSTKRVIVYHNAIQVCDSVVVYTAHIQTPDSSDVFMDPACNSITLPNGEVKTETGVYPVTYPGEVCDSTIRYHVTINHSVTTNLAKTTCNPANVGTFTQIMSTASGCDSTVVTVITFDPAGQDTTVLSATTCDPNQVGSTQTLLTNATGCDSLVITNTTLLQSSTTNLASKTCNPANVGTFTQILSNHFGCDSTVVTIVTFDPAAIDTTVLTATTCDPNQVGSTQTLLTNATGCDSLVITNTTLLQSSTTNLTGTTCNPDSAGVFTQILSNHFGCDSTVIKTVTLLASPQATVDTTSVSCPPIGGNDGKITIVPLSGALPFQFIWGSNQTGSTCDSLAPGVYHATITDANGCSLTLTTELAAPYCPPGSPDTTYLSGATCDTANVGIFTQVLTNQAGLDSVIITTTVLDPSLGPKIEVVDLQHPTTMWNGSIEVTATGGTSPYSYLWENGETSDLIDGLDGGAYYVTVTDANGCFASLRAALCDFWVSSNLPGQATLHYGPADDELIQLFGGEIGELLVTGANGQVLLKETINLGDEITRQIITTYSGIAVASIKLPSGDVLVCKFKIL